MRDQRLLSAFPSKFHDVPAIIADWTEPIGGMRNKNVLDFGCGEGATALGIAVKHNPARVVGVDINLEHKQLSSLANANGVTALPDNLTFEEIRRGGTPSADRFDLIYSWSVFEHIDQNLLGDVVAGLRAKLRDGGHLFVQIAPLYYSPEGSHLWDIGFRHWEHLTLQLDHVHRQLYSALSKPHADSLWSTFMTLNKITAPKLTQKLTGSGFKVLREYHTNVIATPTEDLLLVYSLPALTTDQVVLMLEKA